MKSQDLREIKGAYDQVYLNEFNATSVVDKALSGFNSVKAVQKPTPTITTQKPTGTSGASALGSMSISSPSSARPTPSTPTTQVKPTPSTSSPTLSARAQALRAGGPMGGRRMLNQSFDPFDVIKEYLLDEGYADTEKASLVIMANMSEEWRQSILEQVSGGSLMFTKRFGSSGLPGSTAVTASGQGGSAKGTQFSASGTVGRGTVSGQGDKVNQGIDTAIKNYQTGSSGDTSTSTIRKGAFGSLSANVSGGTAKPAAKPEPVKPQQKNTTPRPPTILRKGAETPRPRTPVETPGTARPSATKPDAYQAARARLEKGGYADAAGNAYPGSQTYASTQSGENPNAAIRAQNAQAFRDLKLVGDANRAAREARSTGVIRGTTQPDGSVVFRK